MKSKSLARRHLKRLKKFGKKPGIGPEKRAQIKKQREEERMREMDERGETK